MRRWTPDSLSNIDVSTLFDQDYETGLYLSPNPVKIHVPYCVPFVTDCMSKPNYD